MALDLVVGAILGVLFDQFRKVIWRVKDNVAMFKPKLKELEQTLEVLSPVIEEIEELNRRSNRANHGTKTIMLKRLLEDGTKLVSKCSKIPRWDIVKMTRYRDKLGKLDHKILKFYLLYVQAYMLRDQKRTSRFVRQTRQMMIMSLKQQGLSNLTIGLTASSTDSSYKLKIVLKVDMQCQKCKVRALNIVAAVKGVSSVAIEDDKKRVVVIGDQVDPDTLARRLRKKFLQTHVLSIAAA